MVNAVQMSLSVFRDYPPMQGREFWNPVFNWFTLHTKYGSEGEYQNSCLMKFICPTSPHFAVCEVTIITCIIDVSFSQNKIMSIFVFVRTD